MWLLHRINWFNQILARISPNPIYLFTWGYGQLLCNFHLPICEKAPSMSPSSFSSAQNNTGCSKIHFTEIVHLTMSNLTRVRFLISTAGSTSDTRLSARTHTRTHTRTRTYTHTYTHTNSCSSRVLWRSGVYQVSISVTINMVLPWTKSTISVIGQLEHPVCYHARFMTASN
jgi:hypothetical protein